MNGYNFTERVRMALARAREEAARLHHSYVGTEHELLGLLLDDESLAMEIIRSFKVNPADLVVAVERSVKPGGPRVTGPDLPYTSRAKKVLEFSMAEARDLHHNYVGTEHILLGLLREDKGIAALVLKDAGITVDAAREKLIAILEENFTGRASAGALTPASSHPGRRTPPPDTGMRGYNFTQRVRLVLANARAEAARLGHEYVGSEHLLLGLVHSDAGVGMSAIDSFGVNPADIATRLEAAIEGGQGSTSIVDLPYTSRAKKVLELAMGEATHLNHAYVGTEHLLLALISEGDGIAAQMLREFGITLEPARDAVRKILGDPAHAEQHDRHIVRNPANRVRSRTDGATGNPLAPSARMAAAIIETLVRDAGVARVFTAQGVDVPKLIAALRDLGRDKPDVERSPEPQADSPPPA